MKMLWLCVFHLTALFVLPWIKVAPDPTDSFGSPEAFTLIPFPITGSVQNGLQICNLRNIFLTSNPNDIEIEFFSLQEHPISVTYIAMRTVPDFPNDDNHGGSLTFQNAYRRVLVCYQIEAMDVNQRYTRVPIHGKAYVPYDGKSYVFVVYVYLRDSIDQMIEEMQFFRIQRSAAKRKEPPDTHPTDTTPLAHDEKTLPSPSSPSQSTRGVDDLDTVSVRYPVILSEMPEHGNIYFSFDEDVQEEEQEEEDYSRYYTDRFAYRAGAYLHESDTRPVFLWFHSNTKLRAFSTFPRSLIIDSAHREKLTAILFGTPIDTSFLEAWDTLLNLSYDQSHGGEVVDQIVSSLFLQFLISPARTGIFGTERGEIYFYNTRGELVTLTREEVTVATPNAIQDPSVYFRSLWFFSGVLSVYMDDEEEAHDDDSQATASLFHPEHEYLFMLQLMVPHSWRLSGFNTDRMSEFRFRMECTKRNPFACPKALDCVRSLTPPKDPIASTPFRTYVHCPFSFHFETNVVANLSLMYSFQLPDRIRIHSLSLHSFPLTFVQYESIRQKQLWRERATQYSSSSSRRRRGCHATSALVCSLYGPSASRTPSSCLALRYSRLELPVPGSPGHCAEPSTASKSLLDPSQMLSPMPSSLECTLQLVEKEISETKAIIFVHRQPQTTTTPEDHPRTAHTAIRAIRRIFRTIVSQITNLHLPAVRVIMKFYEDEGTSLTGISVPAHNTWHTCDHQALRSLKKLLKHQRRMCEVMRDDNKTGFLVSFLTWERRLRARIFPRVRKAVMKYTVSMYDIELGLQAHQRQVTQLSSRSADTQSSSGLLPTGGVREVLHPLWIGALGGVLFATVLHIGLRVCRARIRKATQGVELYRLIPITEGGASGGGGHVLFSPIPDAFPPNRPTPSNPSRTGTMDKSCTTPLYTTAGNDAKGYYNMNQWGSDSSISTFSSDPDG